MQCPRQDKLPFMLVNYWILTYFSKAVKSDGILNFSEPAKSTILNDDVLPSLSNEIWKIECDRELLALAWVDPVERFFNPIIR